MPASPLAVDVTVHEELSGHDVQPLSDVFTDALHRASTVLLLAVGAVGLMAMLDPTQMLRQCLATRFARRLGFGASSSSLGFTAQLLELRLQGGFVLGQRFFKEAPLVSVHGLGLRAVGPALQAGQFEVDLLNLGFAQRDLAVLTLQQRIALGQLDISRREGLVAL